jgi:hypothetical protein
METGPGLPADATLYLLPSTKHVTSPTWVQLGELVRAGKTVYASYFLGTHMNQRGPWWPTMHELFGVRKLTRYGLVDPIEDEVVELCFEKEFGGLAAGAVLRFRAAGNENARAYLPVEPVEAEVIARDAHGRPALLRHRLGEGNAILCTYPLEHMAAESPAINPNDLATFYAALAADAGVAPEVTVAGGEVIVGEMVHEDGRSLVWLINMTDAEVAPDVTLASGALYGLDGDARESVTLAPFGVEVLERR